MDSTEAKRVARAYFDDSVIMSAEIGYETVGTTQFDFKEWEVDCRCFSKRLFAMVDLTVVIHDNVAVYVKGDASI